MPLYDFACPACGARGETVVPLSEYDPAGLPCPECGALAKRCVAVVGIDGPTDTRPLVVEHAGEVFTTKSQLNRYLRDNPEIQMRSPSDSTYRAMVDRTREKCERSARKLGYRDREHRIASERADRKRRRELESR